MDDNVEDTMKWLPSIALFGGLEEPTLKRVVAMMAVHHFEPGQEVGFGRRVEMSRPEIARQGGGDRGEDLRPPRPAEVAGDEGDQDHDERHLDGGQHPHGGRRDAENRDR